MDNIIFIFFCISYWSDDITNVCLLLQEDPDEKKFDGGGMDKDLVEALERDILQRNPNVHW